MVVVWDLGWGAPVEVVCRGAGVGLFVALPLPLVVALAEFHGDGGDLWRQAFRAGSYQVAVFAVLAV